MSLPLFLIPMLVGLTAQGLKPIFNKQWYTGMEAKGEVMPRYGGMPSAHTAFAFSIATLVGLTEGVNSVLFAVVAAIVLFVIDDALRMRVFLGSHGQALHRLVNKLPASERKGFPYLETHLGHRPFEVVMGALLGVGLTWLVMWLVSICCGFIT